MAMTAANNAPKNPNAVDAVSRAHDDVMRLVNHLEQLADRLAGSVPSAVAPGTDHETALSVFREIMDRADSIVTLSDRGQEAIQRIERALP